MSKTLATRLAELSPRTTVTLRLHDEEDGWHVNNNITVGSADSQRRATVFQRLDGSDEWIVAFVDGSPDSGWEIDHIKHFEGEPPGNLTAEEHGDEIDPDELDLVEDDD